MRLEKEILSKILEDVKALILRIDELSDDLPSYIKNPCEFRATLCAFLTGRWASQFQSSREDKLVNLKMIADMSLEIMDVYDEMKE